MAQVDYFLKIDTIDGESTDSKHGTEIDVITWNWSEAQTGVQGSMGGGGAGKVTMQDFHFTALTSKASSKLMLACASGQHIPKAVLTCRKAGTEQQEYLKITMSDLLISSYALGSGSSRDVLPVDTVAINFSKIQFEYAAQKVDGSLDAYATSGWDVKANKKV